MHPPAVWPAAARTSTISCPYAILANDTPAAVLRLGSYSLTSSRTLDDLARLPWDSSLCLRLVCSSFRLTTPSFSVIDGPLPWTGNRGATLLRQRAGAKRRLHMGRIGQAAWATLLLLLALALWPMTAAAQSS